MNTFKIILVAAVALIIAAGALVGVYAVAETIAISVTSAVTSGRGTNAELTQIRLDKLGVALKRTTDAYETARTQCRMGPEFDRGRCLSRVSAERFRVTNEAAPQILSAADDDPQPRHQAPRNLVTTDKALYRTHRQMPL